MLNGDVGGIGVLGLTGEFLAVNETGELKPWLAESWEPNADASEWTFTIRQGVTFNDGTPMTAKDVAATFDRLADPANKSNALSVFKGVLTAGNTTAPDDATVVFKLDAPNGSFPYLVSSDNYNAIILPEAYTGEWTKTFIGTGPWKMDSYAEGASASFSRNDGYWGAKALPDKLRGHLRARGVGARARAPGRPARHRPAGHRLGRPGHPRRPGVPDHLDPGLDASPAVDADGHEAVRRRPGAPRRRADDQPSGDHRRPVPGQVRPRQRQPVRPGLRADRHVGAAARAVDRRGKGAARRGGRAGGFKTELVANKKQEIPEYAQIVADSAKQIGVDISLKVLDEGQYYGDAVFGSSPWLDSVMSLVDYGHRGVPNVLLGAPLLSDGTWNAAHFKNPTYDGLVADYVAAVDIDSQKAAANKIQTLLLEETPIIFAYFYNYLIAGTAGLSNIRGTAIGHIWPDQVSVA